MERVNDCAQASELSTSVRRMTCTAGRRASSRRASSRRRPRHRIAESLEPRQLLAIDFPAAVAVEPLGSLVYRSDVEGTIAAPEFSETLNFELEPNQGFSILLDPTAALKPSIALVGPDGIVLEAMSATEFDQSLGMQPSRVAAVGGPYSLIVSGLDGSSGSFSASLVLNGALEFESVLGISNDGQPGSQLVATRAFGDNGVRAGSVVGSAEPLGALNGASEDFELGVLPVGWQIASSSTAGGVVIGPTDPGEGLQSLVLEVRNDPGAVRQPPREGQATLYYDPATGELTLDTSRPLSTLEIISASEIFDGASALDVEADPFGFNVDRDDKIFRLDVDGFDDFALGPVARTGLTLEFLNRDLRVDGSFLGGGNTSLQLAIVGQTANEATWTLDPSLVPRALSFLHQSASDPIDHLPPTFRGSATGDGVAISLDGGTEWTTVFTPPASDTAWTAHTIDLSQYSTLATAPVQLRIHQSAGGGDTTARQAYDQFQIEGATLAGGDWYQVLVHPGDRLSVAATAHDNVPLELELFADAVTRIATGADSPAGSRVITGFVNNSFATVPLWARVTGQAGADYTLSAAINSEFDFGALSDAVLQSTHGVIGYLQPNERDHFSTSGNYSATTLTPGDTLGINTLDPKLELLAADGAVSRTDTVASDGRNSLLTVRGQDGETIRVTGEQGSSGEYILSRSLLRTPVSATPDVTVDDTGTLVTLRFDYSLGAAAGSGAIDLTPIGADQVSRLDGRSIQFALASVLLDGVHDVSYTVVDVSGVERTGAAAVLVDRTGPRVLRTSVAPNAVISEASLELTITFDDELDRQTLTASAVQLVGDSAGVIPNLRVQPIGVSQLRVIATDLPVDRFTLTLVSGDAGVRNTSGFAMDGELVAPDLLPSGNGQSGGDFVMAFTNLAGVRDIEFVSVPPFAIPNYRATLTDSLASVSDVSNYRLPTTTMQRLEFHHPSGQRTGVTYNIKRTTGETVASFAAVADAVDTIELPSDPNGHILEVVSSVDGPIVFQVELLLNMQSTRGNTHQSLETAMPIDGQFTSLPFGAELATIAADTTGPRELVYEFDFEDGLLPPGWNITAQSEAPGTGVRVTNSQAAASGGFALVMDAEGDGQQVVELTTNQDMAIVYDPATGNLSTLVPGALLTTLEIRSRSRAFTGPEPPGFFETPFDAFAPDVLFQLRTQGTGSVDFGQILPAGLTLDELRSDLTINGSKLPFGLITSEILLAVPPGTRNTVILPLDMTGYTNPVLEFAYASWNDNPNPSRELTTEGVPAAGDGISVSVDGGRTWVRVFTPQKELAPGHWRFDSVNLATALQRNGQQIVSDQLLVALQGLNNAPLPDGGIGFDQIRVYGEVAEPDTRERETIVAANFEDGQLPAGWIVASTAVTPGVGTRVTDSSGAADGSFALLMDGELVDSVEPELATNEDVGIAYDPATGEMTIVVRDGVLLTTLEINSQSGTVFTGVQPALIEPPFDVFVPRKFFHLDTDGFGTVDLGPVATPGLTIDFLRQDLAIAGSQIIGTSITAEILELGPGAVSNIAIVTVDTRDAEQLILEFSHASWNDVVREPRESAGQTGMPRAADGIAISADGGEHWAPLFIPPAQPSGEWRDYTIDLTAALESLDAIGAELLIAFQGDSDNAIPSGGRGYDNIRIVKLPELPPVGYWYEYTLSDGEQSSTVVSADDATFLGAIGGIELYDASGVLLTRGVPSLAGDTFEFSIDDFVDTTTNAADDTYYVRVVDPIVQPFNVSVTRNLSVAHGADPAFTVTDNLLAVAAPPGTLVRFDAAGPRITVDSEIVSPTAAATDVSFFYQDFEFAAGTAATVNNVRFGETQGLFIGPPKPIQFLMNFTGLADRKETFAAISSTPADNQYLSAQPRYATLYFESPLRLDTLEAADFLYDGQAFSSIELVDPKQVRLSLAGLPDGDGPHAISIPAGALLDVSGRTIEAHQIQFVVDSSAPRVTNLNISSGATLPLGPTEIVVSFDEPVVDSFAAPVVVATAENRTQIFPIRYDGPSMRFVVDATIEGPHTLILNARDIRNDVGLSLDGEANGTFPSGNGSPGGDFRLTFNVDRQTDATPVFSAVHPAGSAVYRSHQIPLILTDNDMDSVRVSLAPNQSMIYRVRPVGEFQPDVTLRLPDGSTVSDKTVTSEGEIVSGLFIPSIASGTVDYFIDVRGANGSAGSVMVEVMLGTDLELEPLTSTSNDVWSDAQPLVFSPSPISGISRAAVQGQLEQAAATVHVRVGDDFESGALGPAWQVNRLGDGQVAVGAAPTALNGTNSLVMTGAASAIEFGQLGGSDELVVLVYNPATGELSFDSPIPLTTLQIESASGVFTGTPASGLGDDPFDVDNDNKIFQLEPDGISTSSFGNVTATGLNAAFMQQDIRLSGSYLGGGAAEFALVTLDAAAISEAIFTIQVDELDWISLLHWRSSDETTTTIPRVFNHSMPGDGISISADGQTWHRVHSFSADDVANQWTPLSLPLGKTASALGLDLGRPVQIKLQQTDAAGQRVWDDLRIGPIGSEDWYRFSLADGDDASLLISTMAATADAHGNDAHDVEIEIYDSNQQLIAITSLPTDPTLAAKAILAGQNAITLRDATVDGTDSPYYVRVTSASAADYRLTVGKNAASVDERMLTGSLNELGAVYGYAVAQRGLNIEIEPNNEPANAQDLNNSLAIVLDPNVQDSATVPHASVRGTGDDTYDWYRFEVTSDRATIVLDIDETVNIDAHLRLFRGSELVASSDDAGEDLGSQTSLDSFINYTSRAAGTYYIEVGSCCISPVPGPPDMMAYTLHVSVAGGLGVGASESPPLTYDANAGDALAIGFQPLGAPNKDYVVSLLDPVGTEVTSVASNAGAATRLDYVATASGQYSVSVEPLQRPDVMADFVVTASGSSVGREFAALDWSIAPGEVLNRQPKFVTVKLSDPIRVDSVQADDFRLNGAVVDAVRVVSADTIAVSLPTLGETAFVLELLPDALTSLMGASVKAATLNFEFDETGPRIAASTLAADTVITQDRITVEIQFDQAIDPASLTHDTVRLFGSHSIVTPDSIAFQPETSSFTATFSRLIDDAYELRLSNASASGAPQITDLAGNPLSGEPSSPLPSGGGAPGLAFRVPFNVDLGEVPYDGPYLPIEPKYGDLAYTTERRDYAISDSSDVDTRTFDLQAGQLLTAELMRVDPDVRFTATIRDPQGAVVGTVDGTSTEAASFKISNVPILEGGVYSIDVAGAGGTQAGRVQLTLFLNIDTETVGITNNTQAAALDLDQRRSGLGNVTVLMMGRLDDAPNWFSFTVDDGERFSLAVAGNPAPVMRLLGPDSQLLGVGIPGRLDADKLPTARTINGVVDRTSDGQPDRYWVIVDAGEFEPARLTLRRDGDLETLASPEPVPQVIAQTLTAGVPLLGQLAGELSDRYRVRANAGDTLNVALDSVWRPAGAPHASVRPTVRVLDASGQELGSGTVGADDQPLSLDVAIANAGDYFVEVASDVAGVHEYLLTASGATGSTSPSVIASHPAAGAALSFPIFIRLTFDRPIDFRTIRLDQITVGDVPVLDFQPLDGNTIQLAVDVAAVAPVGGSEYSIQVAAGGVMGVDGQAAAAFTSRFTARINTADVNGDGVATDVDLDTFCANLRAGETLFLDTNGDGAVDVTDFYYVLNELGTRPGDVNLDGRYDSQDFVEVFISGAYESDAEATWRDGDVDCDGRFTSHDFVLAWQYGQWDENERAVAVSQTLDELSQDGSLTRPQYDLDLITALLHDDYADRARRSFR